MTRKLTAETVLAHALSGAHGYDSWADVGAVLRKIYRRKAAAIASWVVGLGYEIVLRKTTKVRRVRRKR